MTIRLDSRVGGALRRGQVIPACPLALTADRRLDERRQRVLIRYYLDAGAGGLAVGVHTTQFAIRDPKHALLRPVLELVAEEMDRADRRRPEPVVRIAGACGPTRQAVAEAELARECGYHAVLVSLGALQAETEDGLLNHCRRLAAVLPVVGFYLQPAVGGRVLPFGFWRRLAEVENVVAVKIAPFNRYQTLDVVRAVVEAGRDDIALYTGNDDNIVLDLVTPFRFQNCVQKVERRIVGGLLGQWAVWTRRTVELLRACHEVTAGGAVPAELLRLNGELTDANAAIFDAANGFAGCIAGVHEVLRRQGILAGTWCLDPRETLSPGQAEEIDRVCRAYPHLTDDEFVRDNLDRWLSG
ncbi:MAG TPA: dihydrodipicolinate synthase family protein [Fimbriiglobus sp.]|nr:dihydrodipicolinate synthase family protein [Fimbriiglobus sp.]